MNKLFINKKNELTQKKKKGFTLIELIIVIAIIAILAAMAIPKFNAVRIDAKVNNDVAAAKNIQSATQTLMANGVIEETEKKPIIIQSNSEKGQKIAARVDSNKGGTDTIVRPEALTTQYFEVKVTNGEVVVGVTGKDNNEMYQLLPADPADKESYAEAARAK